MFSEAVTSSRKKEQEINWWFTPHAVGACKSSPECTRNLGAHSIIVSHQRLRPESIVGFIWECPHFNFYSGMFFAHRPDGIFFSLTSAVTWAAPWDIAVRPVGVSTSPCSEMTSQSFRSDFMTLGGRRGLWGHHLSSARVGWFPDGAIECLVRYRFKRLKRRGPGPPSGSSSAAQ